MPVLHLLWCITHSQHVLGARCFTMLHLAQRQLRCAAHMEGIQGSVPRKGMTICLMPSTPRMTLKGTLPDPGPLCSTLPSTSIILGIIAPAMTSKLSVRKLRGGSWPNSRPLMGAMHPTARPTHRQILQFDSARSSLQLLHSLGPVPEQL